MVWGFKKSELWLFVAGFWLFEGAGKSPEPCGSGRAGLLGGCFVGQFEGGQFHHYQRVGEGIEAMHVNESLQGID